MIGHVFVAIALMFPVLLLLAVLGMELVERPLQPRPEVSELD